MDIRRIEHRLNRIAHVVGSFTLIALVLLASTKTEAQGGGGHIQKGKEREQALKATHYVQARTVTLAEIRSLERGDLLFYAGRWFSFGTNFDDGSIIVINGGTMQNMRIFQVNIRDIPDVAKKKSDSRWCNIMRDEYFALPSP